MGRPSGSQEVVHHPALGFSNVTPKNPGIEERKASLWMRMQEAELCLAALEGDLEKVKHLVNQGVDVNTKDPETGNTLLHFAVESGNFEIFKLLLKNETILYIKNDEDESPKDLLNQLGRQEWLTALSQLEKSPEDQLEHIEGQDNTNSFDQTQKVQSANCVHGSMYKLKIVVLFAYRGKNQNYAFRLGTETNAAKKFPDLVVECTNNGTKEYRFLQISHRLDESFKITLKDLLSAVDSDYSLIKYFFSYQNSKREYSSKGGIIRDFTIYTNIDFDSELPIGIEQKEGEDNMLDAKGYQRQSMRYKLKKADVVPLLKKHLPGSNITKLAGRLAKYFLQNICIKHHDHEFQLYHTVLAKEVININRKKKVNKFHDNFIANINLNDHGQKFRDAFKNALSEQSNNEITLENINAAIDEKKEINKKPIGLTLSKKFGDGEDQSWPDGAFSDQEIEEFLDHLVFAVNQPNVNELDEIIKNEMINNEFDLNLISTEKLYNNSCVYMIEEWFQWKGQGKFLTSEEIKEFFDRTRGGVPLLYGISKTVESFTGRDEDLKNVHEILQRKGRAVISQKYSASGHGGIGKSQLVRKYIEEYSWAYNYKIFWINAESHQTLTESFLMLGEKELKIGLKNSDGSYKKIESIIEDIYKSFANAKSLFIFDNATKLRTKVDNDQGINKFLPIMEGKNETYYLITSSNQKWGEIEVHFLDSFTKEESRSFLQKSLKIEDSSHDSDIEELISILQYFPLALHQAAAYINSIRTTADQFKISDYIKRYKEEAPTLLDSSDLYTRTSFTAWKVTIDAIKNEPKYGKRAAEILDIIAYFAPNNIFQNIFFGSVSAENEEIKFAFQLLKQYSMIEAEEGVLFNIHRLVQHLTRINLTHQSKEQQTMETASKLLIQCFSDKESDASKKRQLLPHFEALKSHMDNWVTNKHQKMEENYFRDTRILECMINGYHELGYVQRENGLLEEIQKEGSCWNRS